MTGRAGTAFRLGLWAWLRTPLLLALLVVLPVYVVLAFAVVLPSTPVPVAVPGDGTVTVATADLYAVLMTPLAGALVGGVAGLFLMQSTREADARLVLAGYGPGRVVAARTGLLAVAGAVVTAVSLAVLATVYVPERVGWFAAATLLAAVAYALVGAVLGLLVDRLPGVYVILFGAMVDLFLYQNPTTGEQAALAPYLPGHWPVRLAVDAGFSGTVDPAAAGWSLVAVLALAVVATVAFWRSTRVG